MSSKILVFDSEGDLLLRLVDRPAKDYDTAQDDFDKWALDRHGEMYELQHGKTFDNMNVTSEIHTDSTSTSDPAAQSTLEVLMQVSSKHLMLASPVFRAMFGPHLLEGQQLKDGQAIFDLPDDNPKASAIVMVAIHQFSYKVPDRLYLRSLTELSILVDKYQVPAAIKRYGQPWLEELRLKDLQKNRSRIMQCHIENIMPLLSIAWVFKINEEFKI